MRQRPNVHQRRNISFGVQTDVVARMKKSIVNELEEDRQPKAETDENHQRIFEDQIVFRRMNRVDHGEGEIFDVIDRIERHVMDSRIAFAKILNDIELRANAIRRRRLTM